MENIRECGEVHGCELVVPHVGIHSRTHDHRFFFVPGAQNASLGRDSGAISGLKGRVSTHNTHPGNMMCSCLVHSQRS